MPTLNTLRETRAAKVAEMRGLSDAALAANRDLDEGERRRFDVLETEVRGLAGRITDAEKIAEFERFEASGERVTGADMSRELRSYSVAKALSEGMSGRLTGIEAEAHQELSRGREVRGVMVPTEILMEARALTTTTPAGAAGGNLIGTTMGPLMDRRRSALKVEDMGATVLRGLSGNLDLPRLAGSGSAGWVAEHAPASRSDARFGKASMSPKTVAAEYEVSRRMLLQSYTALEPILRADLGSLIARAVDAAAIKGGGVNEPSGILNTILPIYTSASIVTPEITSDMIARLETDDVTGTTAFLTHPLIMHMARTWFTGMGEVVPPGSPVESMFHGKRVETSTNVPNIAADNVPEGSAGNVFPLIYGEWASLYIGYWSGVDILVNPYHADVASKGGALIHAFLDADVVVRDPMRFNVAPLDAYKRIVTPGGSGA
ncbi:phage major capsid protein [Haematobacter genomosp. 1]|uniref:Phage major capsid protein n=1 Tax=Haematobacter genomosp. 1 TaxID=366618 RepID=A0A212ACA5_9RHOB|nr:phage major capsid protein [Haematobacter genomosp. 1]OWJ78549.1 phage major capsid protein [Haematobacter genomosp. 1]